MHRHPAQFADGDVVARQESPCHERVEQDGATACANRAQPPRQQRPADGVDQQVDWLGGILVVAQHFGARLHPLRRPRPRDDAMTARELHDERSDRTGRTRDADALAVADRAGVMECGPRGVCARAACGRERRRQRPRHRRYRRRGRDDVLGPRARPRGAEAAAEHAHGCVVVDGAACPFEPGNVRQRLEHRQHAGGHAEIVVGDHSRLQPHEHLVVARLGNGYLVKARRRTELVHAQRPHLQ